MDANDIRDRVAIGVFLRDWNSRDGVRRQARHAYAVATTFMWQRVQELDGEDVPPATPRCTEGYHAHSWNAGACRRCGALWAASRREGNNQAVRRHRQLQRIVKGSES